MPHDKWLEQAELYALGALDGAELREFETHLGTNCRDCEREVARSREAVAVLPRSLAAVAPPAALKARVMDALGPAPTARKGFRWGLPLALAACLVLGIMNLGANYEISLLNARLNALEGQTGVFARSVDEKRELLEFLHDPDVKLIRLEGQLAGRSASGTLLWNAKAARGVFLGHRMEKVPEGKLYEFWVLENGQPLAAGLFDVDENGQATFRLPELPAKPFSQFAVTLEPKEGVQAPTGPILLAGALPA